MSAVGDDDAGDVVRDDWERLLGFAATAARFRPAAADRDYRHLQAQARLEQRPVACSCAGTRRCRPGRRPRVATKRPRRTSSGRCARGLHQGFGQVGRHVESVMPTLSTLRDVGPDTGQRHIDDRKTHHARPQQRGGPSRPASMQAQLDGGRAHRLGERIDHRRAFAVLPTDKADRRKVRAQPELQRCQLFAPGAIEQE